VYDSAVLPVYSGAAAVMGAVYSNIMVPIGRVMGQALAAIGQLVSDVFSGVTGVFRALLGPPRCQ
jgi:hypothetical protein